MRNLFSARTGLLGCAVLCLVSATGPDVQAGEPAREFLQALREAKYHDMALEYLQRMRTSRLAPVELKEILLYETGSTLIQSSRDQRDLAIRENQLDDARDALKRFIGMHPEHALVSSANSQLGNLLVERARIKVEQTKKAGADKTTLLGEAHQVYDDAYKVFERAQVELKEKLSKMKVVDPSDKEKVALRDQLRADYLQAQLLAAAIKEETADTADSGSAEFKTLLTEAASQYGEIYEKYRTRLAGLYARMYQGRCAQKMADYKNALSYLGELMEQPDNPEAFRTMKTKTMLLAAGCWANSKLHAEAVAKLDPWIDKARPNESKTPDWLKLRLELAKAQWNHAYELKKKDSKDPQAKRMESDARKNALFVSRVKGDLQQESRELLAKWGGPKVEEGQAPDPKTFAEAKQAGREALDAIQTANLVLKTVPQRITKEKDDAVKKQLQEQLKTAQETLKTSLADAKRFFRMALSLADRDTDIRDVNIVRYFLCFLYYSMEEYYDAAVVGEFIARRYPDSAGARQSAKIAMASYLKLYTEKESDDKEFESNQIVGIANFITKKWSDQPEAVEALNTLIPFMIQAGDLDMAEKYLNDIPEDSPKRGDAEIKTGQAMWSGYLKGMQDVRKWEKDESLIPEGEDVNAKKATLNELKGRAQAILSAGVARMQQAGEVSEASVTAALSLAQIYVDTGQVDEAVKLLEDEGIGPLSLVRAKHAATLREDFGAEVYKTALRAYISSLAGTADSDAVIKKATDVMDAMKAAIEKDKLIDMYVGLARDLESQMSLASPEDKQALSKGFETFLTRLRSSATDLGVLNWVAETFFSLGTGFDTENKVTSQARKYYQEAADTYETILEKVKFEDPKMKTQIRLRLATAKRKLTKFTDARDLLKAVLTENEMMLDVQVEGAMLYQQWADVWVAQQQPAKALALYDKALRGSEPNPETKKNIIWGWGRLSQVTAKFPQFRNTFHEGRYNLAFCRYSQARASSEKSGEADLLAKAKRAIVQTQQLYGQGDEWQAWRPRYDALMKNIQKQLGERPGGLPEEKEKKKAITE